MQQRNMSFWLSFSLSLLSLFSLSFSLPDQERNMGYDTKLHHQKGRKMFINSHLLHILVVWLERRFQLGVDIDVHAFALGQFLFFCLVLYVSHISPQIRVMSTLNFLPLLWTWSEFHNSTCWFELNISSKTWQSYHVQNNHTSKKCMPIFV